MRQSGRQADATTIAHSTASSRLRPLRVDIGLLICPLQSQEETTQPCLRLYTVERFLGRYRRAMATRKWSDLTRSQQRVITVVGIVEGIATLAALSDLSRRPQSGVRGPKAAWALACFVQPVGPLAYFVVGRRDPQ